MHSWNQRKIDVIPNEGMDRVQLPPCIPMVAAVHFRYIYILLQLFLSYQISMNMVQVYHSQLLFGYNNQYQGHN